jgi:D-sedoheptulose 7-phosphate isomerase
MLRHGFLDIVIRSFLNRFGGRGKLLDADQSTFYREEPAEYSAVFKATRKGSCNKYSILFDLVIGPIDEGGRLIFFCNGDRAADAQHLEAELTVPYLVDRIPIPAIAFNTDISVLTAIGNDLGFDQLFARKLRALGRSCDPTIEVSTSAGSPNFLAGLWRAQNMGTLTAALTRQLDRNLKRLTDIV